MTDSCNEVRLVGRLSAVAEERALPSGDVLVQFRVLVGRPEGQRRAGTRRVTVDALDCVAWTAATRRAALSWEAGDVVEVRGALRRRFWRSGGGAASRCEVEVLRGKRVSRAA